MSCVLRCLCDGCRLVLCCHLVSWLPQAALRKIPTAPVTLEMKTVNQEDEEKTFTLCTLSKECMQQRYAWLHYCVSWSRRGLGA